MYDEKEFKKLFDLYYIPLCYFARKFKLDYFESEEVVQRVFVNLWEKGNDVQIQKSASAYLYQSVRNQSINLLKQKSVVAKNKEELAKRIKYAELFSAVSEEDGSSVLQVKELNKEIEKAIDNLPEKCKEIFLLSRKENLSVKEISGKLNISTNTVQKQISIAITKIKDVLKYYLTLLLAVISQLF